MCLSYIYRQNETDICAGELEIGHCEVSLEPETADVAYDSRYQLGKNGLSPVA